MTHTSNIINAIIEMAVSDARNGVPYRDPSNTGALINDRLFGMHVPHPSPRNGDAAQFRHVYSAARFLLKHQDMIG